MILPLPIPAPNVDPVVFGSPASEAAHRLVADASEVLRGGLGESARRFLPKSRGDWRGGGVAFEMRVDPERQNYVTARFWGDDVSDDQLILLCDGKQIGYRHLGEVEPLDAGSPQPVYNGRFYYSTSPLPMALTRGKTRLHFEIRSSGPIFGYANTWEQYQKPMLQPTRGVYRIVCHTDPLYTPAADERQGESPKSPPVRKTPGPEVVERVKARVNRTVEECLGSNGPLNQMQMQFLARAYNLAYTPAYQNRKVADKVAEGLDALAARFRQDPKSVMEDPATPNPGWFGTGPAGEAVWRLSEPLRSVAGSRRLAWVGMLRASIDYNTARRKQYTNQSMIVDLDVALANNGLRVLAPEKALPQAQALRYLYESIGLEPWRGSETDHGPSFELGKDYWQLTRKGLTKELGYTGYYGEILDWVCQIYEASRPSPETEGDPRIKAQLVKLSKARAVFRYPMLDSQGYRAMRIETVVGWRDEGHIPGEVAYAERTSWDGSAIEAPALTLAPALIGYVGQMMDDGQLYASIERQEADNGSLRATVGLMGVPDQFARIMAFPRSKSRLPMSPEVEDFVWSDPENGVVAIRHGRDTLFASLYWRARYGVNGLARVHYTRPERDHIAVVHVDERFEPSGQTYTKPDWTNFDFGGGGVRYPDGVHSALAGKVYPIAKIPEGVPFQPGQESPYAGRARFYTLRYGPYLIAMNAGDQPEAFDVPPSSGPIRELASRRKIGSKGASEKITSGTTAVYLYDRWQGPENPPNSVIENGKTPGVRAKSTTPRLAQRALQ